MAGVDAHRDPYVDAHSDPPRDAHRDPHVDPTGTPHVDDHKDPYDPGRTYRSGRMPVGGLGSAQSAPVQPGQAHQASS